MVAVVILKSGSDYEMKIADRFSHKNRDPVSRSVSTCGPETGFQTQIDSEIKIADQFSHENRDPIAE